MENQNQSPRGRIYAFLLALVREFWRFGLTLVTVLTSTALAEDRHSEDIQYANEIDPHCIARLVGPPSKGRLEQVGSLVIGEKYVYWKNQLVLLKHQANGPKSDSTGILRRILLTLVRHHGNWINREEFIDEVWPDADRDSWDAVDHGQMLSVYMSRIRAAFQLVDPEFNAMQTHQGRVAWFEEQYVLYVSEHGLEVNESLERVRWRGTVIDLSPIRFAILNKLLWAYPAAVKQRDLIELIQVERGDYDIQTEGAQLANHVSVLISALRREFKKIDPTAKPIQSVTLKDGSLAYVFVPLR